MTLTFVLALVLAVEPDGLSMRETLAKIRAARAGGDVTRASVTYDDIPEFPSWRIESAATRKIRGLPPVKFKRTEK